MLVHDFVGTTVNIGQFVPRCEYPVTKHGGYAPAADVNRVYVDGLVV